MFQPGQLTQVGGGAISLYGGYKAEKAKRKAAKARAAALAQAMQQYKRGSTDAQGNTLSADASGRWKYNLSNAGKGMVSNANRNIYEANAYIPKNRSQKLRENLANTQLANNLTARANNNASMRSSLRTGSNAGNIANSNAANGSYNLRNNFLNASKDAKNVAAENAQMRNALSTNISTAQQPVQNIQSNLQNMVNSLNSTVMGQGNRSANAVGDPYMHGMSKAKTIQGTGGYISGIGKMINQNYAQDRAQVFLLLQQLLQNGGQAGSAATMLAGA